MCHHQWHQGFAGIKLFLKLNLILPGWYEYQDQTVLADALALTNLSPSTDSALTPHIHIWVRSWNCGCLVTWFCYQLIAKPANKTATVPWPDSYSFLKVFWQYIILSNVCRWDTIYQNVWWDLVSHCGILGLIFLVLKPKYSRKTWSIPWLLMPWLFESPGHQQQ